MTRQALGTALTGALVISTAAVLTAAGAPSSQQARAQAQAAERAEAQAVTVEGCVSREQDVAGRRPNLVERAGVAEDYILTQTKMIRGKAPAFAGRAAMYEIGDLDSDQLKPYVGKRVQIDGTFDHADRAAEKPSETTPNDDLVELNGTRIREVAGASCGK